MESQAEFWGFDRVIAHFTQCAQQNDLQKVYLVIKVRNNIFLTQFKSTDSN